MNEEKDDKTTQTQPAPAQAREVAPKGKRFSSAASEQLVDSTLSPFAKQHESKGEKLFDWAVYKGINYWANLGISLVLIDFFKVGKGKQPLIGITEKTSTALNKIGISADKAAKQAKLFWDNVAYPSGGWVILAPMKYMEDRKRPMVHWLNKKLGVDQKAPDGHEMTADEIYIAQEQPKQSWGNVLVRRVKATFAVWASVFAVNNTIGGKKVEDYVVAKADKAFKSGYVPGGEWASKQDWIKRYISYASLDAFYTKVTEIVMHRTNGAAEAKMPKEIGDEAPSMREVPPGGTRFIPADSLARKFTDTVKSKKAADIAQAPKDSFVTTVQQQPGTEQTLGA